MRLNTGNWLRAIYTTILFLIVTVITLVCTTSMIMTCFGTVSRVCELACHLMPMYIVAALFALVLILADGLLMRRKLILAKVNGVFLVAVLLCCTARVLPLWLRSDKAPQAVELSLLHLNLAGERNKNFTTIFEQVANEKPDVVLISESTPVWMETLKTKLHKQYPYYDRGGFTSELAIYSKYPISGSELRKIKFIDRKRILAKILHPTLGVVTLLLVHPVIPIYDVSLAARNEEFELYPKDLRESAGPCILAGDLNCTPWSPYFDRLLKAANLKDSERGFGYLPTWPDVMVKLLITIDHILVSKDLSVKERRTLGNAGSDHLPVLVKVGRCI